MNKNNNITYHLRLDDILGKNYRWPSKKNSQFYHLYYYKFMYKFTCTTLVMCFRGDSLLIHNGQNQCLLASNCSSFFRLTQEACNQLAHSSQRTILERSLPWSLPQLRQQGWSPLNSSSYSIHNHSILSYLFGILVVQLYLCNMSLLFYRRISIISHNNFLYVESKVMEKLRINKNS